jgi:hypothetical protein
VGNHIKSTGHSLTCAGLGDVPCVDAGRGGRVLRGVLRGWVDLLVLGWVMSPALTRGGGVEYCVVYCVRGYTGLMGIISRSALVTM